MTTDAKTNQSTAKQHQDSAKRPFNPDGGEDEASTSHDGDESHLHDDQKPEAARTTKSDGNDVDADDPHKAVKLTKAGRDLDPDDGAD